MGSAADSNNRGRQVVQFTQIIFSIVQTHFLWKPKALGSIWPHHYEYIRSQADYICYIYHWCWFAKSFL